MRSNGISVISNRRHISLPVEDILYVLSLSTRISFMLTPHSRETA